MLTRTAVPQPWHVGQLSLESVLVLGGPSKKPVIISFSGWPIRVLIQSRRHVLESSVSGLARIAVSEALVLHAIVDADEDVSDDIWRCPNRDDLRLRG